MARRAVLVGAGHAHLGVLAATPALVARGVEVVVVAPGDFWYSGLATGMLGGEYAPAADRVDVAGLVTRGGGRFVRDTAVAIEPDARRVRLASGGRLDYDVCSLDVGSTVASETLPGASAYGVAVKPIARLAELRRTLEGRFGAAGTTHVVVVGVGATGLEVAANVAALARRHGASVAVTVLGRGRPLSQASPRAADDVTRTLERGGVRIVAGVDVTLVERGRVHVAGGGTLRYDVLVLATGLVASPLARVSGLPVDAEGAMLTDECLCAMGHHALFGGGDAIAFRGRALPRIGVHAVRQAPVLLANLLATLDGRQPRAFRPQRRFLLVMNLGDRTGVALWGRWHWRGRLAWLLKDRIDRRWMARWHATARVGSHDPAAAG